MAAKTAKRRQQPTPQAKRATPQTLLATLKTESVRKGIMQIVPKHLNPERLLTIALLAVGRTPKLQDCTTESVLRCIMDAAKLGLDVGGSLGHCYLIPFGTTCTLILGYRGLITLARRGGEVADIEARCVYESELDQFSIEFGTSPKLRHWPDLRGESDLSNIVGAYCCARLVDNALPHVEYMSKADIDKIRAMSRAKDDGPWVEHYPEMARKTLVRRTCKYLPMTEDLAAGIQISDDAEFGGALDSIAGILPDASPEVGRRQFGFKPTTAAENVEIADAERKEKRSDGNATDDAMKANDRWCKLSDYAAAQTDGDANAADGRVKAWLAKNKWDLASLGNDTLWVLIWAKAQKEKAW